MSTRPDFPLSPLTLDAVQAAAIKRKLLTQTKPAGYVIDIRREANMLPQSLADTALGNRDLVTGSLLRIAADALLLIEWIEGNGG